MVPYRPGKGRSGNTLSREDDASLTREQALLQVPTIQAGGDRLRNRLAEVENKLLTERSAQQNGVLELTQLKAAAEFWDQETKRLRDRLGEKKAENRQLAADVEGARAVFA
jgi:hypothetical protein